MLGEPDFTEQFDAVLDVVLTCYEHGPFGELIRATGPMAKLNPFRFSTKYQDDESDLLYYGFRYLNNSTGRWFSRDPLATLTDIFARIDFLQNCGLGDDDAESLARDYKEPAVYCFVNNSAISGWDYSGLICLHYLVSGTFTPVDEIGHKWNKTLGNNLSYTACCPCSAPSHFSLVSPNSIWSPGEALATWTILPPTRSGSCYKVTVEVPWRAAKLNRDSTLNGIMLLYDCCIPFL